MSEEKPYPLYPELSELGKLEAQELVENIKSKIRKAMEDVMGDFYTGIPDYIESDSWTNYRNTLLRGLTDYSNSGKYRYDFQEIRQAIYKENKEQIDKDLNQDLLEEIERLKGQVKHYQELREFSR